MRPVFAHSGAPWKAPGNTTSSGQSTMSPTAPLSGPMETIRSPTPGSSDRMMPLTPGPV